MHLRRLKVRRGGVDGDTVGIAAAQESCELGEPADEADRGAEQH